MSWKATAFVKEIRTGITQTEKLVLLILADYHNSAHKASWPSLRVLAEDCLMSERNLSRVLTRLVKDGHLLREKGDGRGNVSSYQFAGLDVPVVPVVVKGDKVSPFTQPQRMTQRVTSEPLKDDIKDDTQGTPIRKEQDLELGTGSLNGEEPAPDLPVINLAIGLCEKLSMVAPPSTLRVVAEAIRMRAKLEGLSPPRACDKFLAVFAGRSVTRFDFEDRGKWDGARNGVSKGQQREDDSNAAIAGAMRAIAAESQG